MKKNKNKFSIQKKNSKRPIVILTAVLLLILIGGLVSSKYLESTTENSKDNSINLDKPTDEQLDYGSDAKKQSIDRDKADGKAGTGSDPIPAPKTIEGSDKKYVNSEITSINQSTSELNIRTLIQTVTSAGTCTLHLKGPQGQAISLNSTVQPLPSSTTCKGFDIPLDELSNGLWYITLSFNSDSLTSTSAKEYTVK